MTPTSAFADRPRLRIAITGASGMIGSNLARLLTESGHTVLPMVRRQQDAVISAIYWNPSRGEIDSAALEGVDAVIHLAGKNIGSSLWTKRYMVDVRSSRVEGTALLAKTLASLRQPPRVFISASAIGYYGSSETEIFTEESPSPRDSFLSRLCVEWEAAAEPARQRGIRVVHPRFGMVLAVKGPPLSLMLPLFRLGLGGVLGSGRQWMSWIALADLLTAVSHLLHDESNSGPVNLVSPQSVTNKEFTLTLARVLHRPAFFHAPASILRIALGQMADELLLCSSRVQPTLLLKTGYPFQFPDLGSFLRQEVGGLKKGANLRKLST